MQYMALFIGTSDYVYLRSVVTQASHRVGPDEREPLLPR